MTYPTMLYRIPESLPPAILLNVSDQYHIRQSVSPAICSPPSEPCTIRRSKNQSAGVRILQTAMYSDDVRTMCSIAHAPS